MVFKGCERSVITYSSLISACEKAGQSDLAMELFQEMAQEGCVPNTVTYNSLITACAQGRPPPPSPRPATPFQQVHMLPLIRHGGTNGSNSLAPHTAGLRPRQWPSLGSQKPVGPLLTGRASCCLSNGRTVG